jgi:hypothetical protein
VFRKSLRKMKINLTKTGESRVFGGAVNSPIKIIESSTLVAVFLSSTQQAGTEDEKNNKNEFMVSERMKGR